MWTERICGVGSLWTSEFNESEIPRVPAMSQDWPMGPSLGIDLSPEGGAAVVEVRHCRAVR